VSAPFEGSYGEPNTFGGYLVFMLAMILAYALCAQALSTGIAWLAFAGLVTAPFLYTLSRVSWLAAIPMLLTLIVLSTRRLALLMLLGVLVILGPLAFPKQVVDRYNYTLNERGDRSEYRIGGSRLDTSTAARLDSWKYGLAGWTKRPFLGYGVTGFAFMDAQFVRVLVETGLIGLAAFLWLLWRLLRVAWNAHQRFAGSRFEGLTLGYIAGLVAIIAHSVGANTFVIVRIMEPFWFMTAVIVTIPEIFERARATAHRALAPSGSPAVR
jgi:O-antigen ligase